MSISTEIERLQNAKAEIKSAIEEKGVEVGDGRIDTYAEKISQITSGDGGYNTKSVKITTSVSNVEELSNIVFKDLDDTRDYVAYLSFSKDKNLYNKIEFITNIESNTVVDDYAIRYRNGIYSHITITSNFDAAVTIGDVYTVVDLTEGGWANEFEMGKNSEYDRFWDAVQNYGNRKDYDFCFAGDAWTIDTFKPKYPIVPTSCQNAFAYWGAYSDRISTIDFRDIQIDLSKSKTLANCFYNNQFIVAIGEVDITSSRNFNNFFSGAKNLHTIEKLIVDNNGETTFNTPFSGCGNLENIVFEGVIGNDIQFHHSPLLTHESLMSIINALKDFRIVNSTYSNVTYSWDGTEGDGEIGKVYECTDSIKYNNSIEFRCIWGNNEYDYRIMILEVDNVNITDEELYNVKTFMIDSNGNLVLAYSKKIQQPQKHSLYTQTAKRY
jgi:hypothetical protein